MRKLIFSIALLYGVTTNAQQLLEVLKPHTASSIIPEGVKLDGGYTLFPSIYDTDYLPYTKPTTAADWTTHNANGTTDTEANYQGTITQTGKTIYIPVSVTANATIPAYTTTAVTIPAERTEDGQSRDIIITWEEQAVTTSTTYITATLKTVSGILNIKKLDVNTGIGNDYKGVLLGNIVFPATNANATATHEVRAIAAIPDRKFGDGKHDFLYLPITAEDGNTWLNNNLGANYANTNSEDYNLAQQATSHQDYKAYGSLFQWRRPADDHELINWTGATTGTPLNDTTTTTQWDNTNWAPDHSNFVVHSSGRWVTEDVIDNTTEILWAANGANNPCPEGFNPPDVNEWDTLLKEVGTQTNEGYNYWSTQSPLRLSMAGYRDYEAGVLDDQKDGGYYWGRSSVTEIKPFLLRIEGANISYVQDGNFLADGYAVRCIQAK